SHALQGVDLTLDHGVLSVVGRNGMGKSTLCRTIMGLQPAAGGSIRFDGRSILGLPPAQIARLGIGYVPQGRRLWPSLTVDEHLRLGAARDGAWSIDRIYSTFPRLAERETNRGGQLSGGEQQMLAISRALLLNPKLLVMDEPTEGLAPVIVSQVEAMLAHLEDEGDISVLLIEQNIGVATATAETVAIMVNGRINRLMDARQIAGDRDLQQRLLGVGRHGHEEVEEPVEPAADEAAAGRAAQRGPQKIYLSNPVVPTRWTSPVPVERIERAARTVSDVPRARELSPVAAAEIRPLSSSGEPVVLVCGTLDTKGAELRFIRDRLKARGIRTRLVDLSTTRTTTSADVPAHQVAVHHPEGPNAVFSEDRGRSVAGMAQAFEAWIERQSGIAGIIGAGGSGGTAMIAPAMRRLPVGIPKVLISTVASGDVRRYVGPADIMMLHSVADVQGLNTITRDVLGNGAEAMAGMVKARAGAIRRNGSADARPAIGLTMFGVTTPCIRQVTAALEADFDCLVFHATGIGGQAMEALVDSGKLEGVLDLTTTEVCDLLMGGIFPADEDRFGAMIRARMPYVGSVGALDMVNFGAPETVPEHYRGRRFYQHNPEVTLMRTTPDENARMGRWIGGKLNQMDGPVRFFLPQGGVSALDAPGQPFHDPEADRALFDALEATVRTSANRRLIRLPQHINDPAFASAIVEAFLALHGGRPSKRRAGL
ncbi:MAG: ABC transporter permease, partial [Geminicoccaceae bacterium]|nr:ABC transporter permease [Geminicoccaceae bacterium]